MNSNGNSNEDHPKAMEEGMRKSIPQESEPRTNISYHLSDEQFEKLLQKRSSSSSFNSGNAFADPNPLAFSSFVIPLTPVTACLMYWGDSTPISLIGLTGQMLLTGGIGLWIASLLTFLNGGTYAMITFAMYGSFWFGLGFVNLPSQSLVQTLGGPTSTLFTDAFGAYMMSFAIFNLIMAILALRVNVAFFTVFSTVFMGTTLLSAGYWRGKHDADEAERLFKAAGAILFVTVIDGWYLFADAMMASVGFKKRLPMGNFTGGFGRFKSKIMA